MAIIHCEPIKGGRSDIYDNIIMKDSNDYPFAIGYIDLFYNENDSTIHDKIKSGAKFKLKVELIEE